MLQDYLLSKQLTEFFGENEAANIMVQIARDRIVQREIAQREREQMKKEIIGAIRSRISISTDISEAVQKIDVLKTHIDNLKKGW